LDLESQHEYRRNEYIQTATITVSTAEDNRAECEKNPRFRSIIFDNYAESGKKLKIPHD